MKKSLFLTVLLFSFLVNSCAKEKIRPQNQTISDSEINAIEVENSTKSSFIRVIGEIGKTNIEQEITIHSGYIEGDILYLVIDYPEYRNLQFRAIGDPEISKTYPPQRNVTIKYEKSDTGLIYGGLNSSVLAIEIKPFRIAEQLHGTVILNINNSLLSFTYTY